MKSNLPISLFFAILAVVLPIFPLSVKSQDPDWLMRLKQQRWMQKVASLKLLETNRLEVEKVLGKPDFRGSEKIDFMRDYDTENGYVSVTYTTKECTSIDGKIPKDTIEEIEFRPKADVSFSKLGLPRTLFEYSPFSDTPGGIYKNEQTGVSFAVQDSGRIESIEFEIPDQKNFSCVTVSSFLSDLEKVKGLKLLESNRDEVRKTFAGYEKSLVYKDEEYKDKYDTSDARIEFIYAQGKCQFDDSDEYDNPEWNVEQVKISPDNDINPQEFGFNLDQYKKEKVYQDVNDLYVYHSKEAGIIFRVRDGKVYEINLFPPQKYNSLMCDKERAKKLSATDSIFTERLADRISFPYNTASVKNLYLSQREIISANDSGAVQIEFSKENAEKVFVLTRVNNPQGDVLTYNYTVTGGKIVGRGEKVLWDLSGVKAGNYTITAAVDDGCGFCGQSKTKTMIVK